jgi:hypothetical protein
MRGGAFAGAMRGGAFAGATEGSGAAVRAPSLARTAIAIAIATVTYVR